MTKSGIFFVVSLGFLGGVFVASFFQIEKSFLLMLAAGAVAVFVLNLRNKKAIIVGGAIIFFILGVWRTNGSIDVANDKLENEKKGLTEFSGVVLKEPETDEKYQKIIVGNGDQKKESGRILINAPVYPKYEYGDKLNIKCVLEKPKNYEDSLQGRSSLASLKLGQSGPGAAKFDYQMYLAKDEIYRVCGKADILLLRKSSGNAVYQFIFDAKNKFEKGLSAVFPDPEGAYLKGLLLGGSKRMTDNLNEAFQRTGTTHTVAVSGYNVTIVAAFLMEAGIIIGLWRQQVFSFALAGIVLFVVATGAPSSAVRAGIMGTLVIWAMKEGRIANSTNAIMLAAAAMLLINPLLLRYDAGFQLSFLATLGIVYLSPIFEKFWWGRPPRLVQETVILSISAIVFVLPVILYSFENLSLVSPFANFVILPAIPYIMGGGMVAGIVGLFFAPLGKLIGFVPYLLLKAELFLVQWMASWPWASVEIKSFGWAHMLAYYLLLFGIMTFFRRKKPALEKAGESVKSG